MSKCLKCNGTGYIERFKHIEGGECFECGGSGVAFDADEAVGKVKPQPKQFFYLSCGAQAFCFRPQGDSVTVKRYRGVPSGSGRVRKHSGLFEFTGVFEQTVAEARALWRTLTAEGYKAMPGISTVGLH